MYSILPSFVLGFHGCDQSVAESILSGRINHLRPSQNTYDWLGHGVYFWENSPARALEYARLRAKRPAKKHESKIRKPAVVGAVINLGTCMNLMDSKFFPQIQEAYRVLKMVSERSGRSLPQNRPLKASKELLLRDLDCHIINLVHEMRDTLGEPEFDSVRSAFIEGVPLYPGGTFLNKNHIQICVRNLDCIKGYFRPLVATRE